MTLESIRKSSEQNKSLTSGIKIIKNKSDYLDYTDREQKPHETFTGVLTVFPS